MGEPEKKLTLIYELTGIVFIVIVGTILHFTFEFSGNQPIIGVFSAVNESVWEHLKLGFWPALVWFFVEYRSIRRSTNNFVFAKTVGIYLIPIIIPVLFYSYTAIIGESVLAIDILTFILSIIVGQFVSYKLLTYRDLPEVLNKISLVALIILGGAFVLFTFYPPNLSLFRDPVTGGYGITNHAH